MLDTQTPFLHDIKDIAEFEFYLLESLGFYTIVYQPYRTLMSVCRDAQVSMLDTDPKLDDNALQKSWQCINDSYTYSDMCLLYPPHLIAIAALQISLLLVPEDDQVSNNLDLFKRWLTAEVSAQRVYYKNVCKRLKINLGLHRSPAL